MQNALPHQTDFINLLLGWNNPSQLFTTTSWAPTIYRSELQQTSFTTHCNTNIECIMSFQGSSEEGCSEPMTSLTPSIPCHSRAPMNRITYHPSPRHHEHPWPITLGSCESLMALAISLLIDMTSQTPATGHSELPWHSSHHLVALFFCLYWLDSLPCVIDDIVTPVLYALMSNRSSLEPVVSPRKKSWTYAACCQRSRKT